MIKWIYIGFYAIKSNKHFQNVNYLFGVSDENFRVSVDNVGVSGMVVVGVSGTTPMMLLSSYTQNINLAWQ